MRSDVGGIVLLYEKKIQRFFHSRIGSPEDVEDLTAEVICAVIDGYPRFRGKSAISTWIYAICRHVLYSYFARKRRDRYLVESAKLTVRQPLEDRWILRDAVERLPPLYRKLYTECYMARRKVKDIAVLLGKPEGTVKYLLYDLRRRLRSSAGPYR